MAHQIAVIAAIRPGRRAELEQVLAGGPPFDLAEQGFTRHLAFVGEKEVVFVFEGEHATADARRLTSAIGITHLTRMARLISGPHVLTTSFAWEAEPAGSAP